MKHSSNESKGGNLMQSSDENSLTFNNLKEVTAYALNRGYDPNEDPTLKNLRRFFSSEHFDLTSVKGGFVLETP